MSSKQSTSKPDPRIAQKEAMVTRHKSAQMKRQLRNKNRSMKHLTDLLKSPTRDTQTVSKIQTKTKSPKLKSLLKSAEKVQKLPEKVFKLSKVLRKKIAVVRDAEYYPNKRKRKVDVKKVELKPSHKLQTVGSITGSVKRKSGVPLKASSKPKQPKESSPVYSRLSMAEAIRIVEADLTDEDMMEILTCPSPVWWEDPPDEEYIEDAIFTQSPPQPTRNSNTPGTLTPDPKTHEEMEVNPPAANNDDDVADKPIEITNIDSKGDKFLKKRSKLEGLLGNIKHKSGKVYQSKKDIFNEDLVVICSNCRKESSSNNKDNNSNSDNKKTSETQSESDGDEILFHDTSMNEDELLRDLENIDIPIENQSRPSDIIVIDDDDDDFLDKTTDNSSSKEISSDETISSNNNKLETPKVEGTTLKTNSNDKLNVEPNSIPFLQKHNVGKEFSSPKSIDSISPKTNASSNQDMDTISDTNIRFLLDDEAEEQNKNISSLEKAEKLKSNEDLNTVDSQNVSHGLGNPDKLKSSNNLNKDDNKNISDGLEKSDEFKTNHDFSSGHSKNITDDLEKANKLKLSNDLNASHSNVFQDLETTDKLEPDTDLSLDDTKSITDDLEYSKKLKSSKDLNEVHNKNVFDGVENPDNLESSKVFNTSDAKNICDDVETVAESNLHKGFNADDQNRDSTESLKKYKNTSKKSITVFKIIEESDNSETDNSNSNNDMSQENGTEGKEDKQGVKINDYYKKCKKVYQKRSKKIEDRTDINKNLKQIKDIENDTKFILCELCKPKTKKVSDDKNVKYCLKCSSIFDSKDCTYCIEKSKSKVYTCVPCKMRFCCESFYYKHALEHLDMGLSPEQTGTGTTYHIQGFR